MHDPMPQPRERPRHWSGRSYVYTYREFRNRTIRASVVSGTLGAAIGGLLTWLTMN